MRIVVALITVALGATAGWAVPDHLKCYKVKDPLVLQGVVDLYSPQFGLEPGCKIFKAKLFCVPVTKTVVIATNRVTGNQITPLLVAGRDPGDRICYKIKCLTPGPASQQVTDQFGNRVLTEPRPLGGFKADLLCTPAYKGTTFCGDGTVDAGEECDASALGGATCQSEGFASGTLACGPGCTFDTSGCGCGPSSGSFPATGQTTCWNSAGTVIPCAGTGHDGEIQAGATLSYTDNGNGTITDNNTGLMWEKLSDDGTIHDWDTNYTWNDAFAVKVAGLNGAVFAGHTDWRVPNAKELQSIVNYQNAFPSVSAAFNTACAPGCTVTTCSCTRSGVYWSSSTYALSPTGAWFVNFDVGNVSADSKPVNFAVRAVRGGS